MSGASRIGTRSLRPSHVPPSAQAYRKAARQWHPDVNPSEEAKEKFQAINEAYGVSSGAQSHDGLRVV